jgi:hypothetical protein
MSGYCPAGKCECKNFVSIWRGLMKGAPITSQACNLDIRLSEGSLHLYEVCPWPSRQVPVRPYAEDCAAQEAEKQEGRYCPDTKRNCQFLTPTPEELDEMLGIAKNAGRRAGIEECMEAVKHIKLHFNADIVVQRDAIAAMEKLRARAVPGGREE